MQRFSGFCEAWIIGAVASFVYAAGGLAVGFGSMLIASFIAMFTGSMDTLDNWAKAGVLDCWMHILIGGGALTGLAVAYFGPPIEKDEEVLCQRQAEFDAQMPTFAVAVLVALVISLRRGGIDSWSSSFGGFLMYVLCITLSAWLCACVYVAISRVTSK